MKLFSVSEFADLMGISKALVYALCSRRRLRHERHGLGRGTIRIPEDAIDEYRRSVTVDAEPGAKPHLEPADQSGRTATFTMLDADRLREAWQGR